MHSVKEILGFQIQAEDDEFGKLADLFVDDRDWNVRYLVLDTGNWLPGRRVLVAPASVGEPDWRQKQIPVVLNRVQVENSPALGTDLPVSRQHEEALSGYFGWPRYWMAAGVPTYGPLGLPHNAPGLPMEKLGPDVEAAAARPPEDSSRDAGRPPEGDPHLRSFKEVKGYHIQAVDGEIGHVEDFLGDLRQWRLHQLVVDTRNWLPGKHVIVPCDAIEEVDWSAGKVSISLTRQEVKQAPEANGS